MSLRHSLCWTLLLCGLSIGGFGALPLQAASQTAFPASLSLSLSGGWAGYVEDLSTVPVESEWDAGVAGLDLQAVLPLDPVVFSLRGAVRNSDKDREEWRYDEVLVQINDLEFDHQELLIDIGLATESAGNLQWFPYVGLGIRQQDFSRSNFTFISDPVAAGLPEVTAVGESYEVTYLNLGIQLMSANPHHWDIGFRADLGWVLDNEADNSMLGSIDGDGGFIFQFEGYAIFPVVENQFIGAGLKLDAQALVGDYSIVENDEGAFEVTEWPDNTLMQMLVTVFYKIQL